MRLIIAGSRGFTDELRFEALLIEALRQMVQTAADQGWSPAIHEVVSGHAAGVDRMGERWAGRHNIPVKLFPVTHEEWKLYGSKGPGNAAYRRNEAMAQYAARDPEFGGALFAIWQEQSGGTANMIANAVAAGLYVAVRVV